MDKSDYLQLLQRLIVKRNNDPAFLSLSALLQCPERLSVDTDWGLGAQCDDLLDLYEFRLNKLGSPCDERHAQLELLCDGLRQLKGQRCLLSSVSSADARFSVFMDQDLSMLLGCIGHIQAPPDSSPATPRG
jgi:hypothetical protein